MELIHNTSYEVLIQILETGELKRRTTKIMVDKEDIELLLPISLTTNPMMETDQDVGCISGDIKIYFKKEVLELKNKKISYRANSYFDEDGLIKEDKFLTLQEVFREYRYKEFMEIYNSTFNKKENRKYLIDKLQPFLNFFKREKEISIYSNIPISLIERVTVFNNNLLEHEELQSKKCLEKLLEYNIENKEMSFKEFCKEYMDTLKVV